MKLISMIEYIETQERAIPDELNVEPTRDWDRLFVKRIISYARFLKQPLKLEMFVPCDEEGNILKEPDDYKKMLNHNFYASHKASNYKKSKEKVLLEGFEVKPNFENIPVLQKEGINQVWSYLDKPKFTMNYPSMKWSSAKIVEDLTTSDLTLTPSAIKLLTQN